ncbi:MAG: PIG-L family deacetylase [Chloroflexota bacterium]|nr:PIG-L family deacetylase [Dehalococcoidia bacterium]MDW8253936.1 PIG-L family deacetylase [Chloroflexota bacterium]
MPGLTILAVLAHPDDEGVCAGTLVKNVRLGGRSILICATRGEVGEISDPALATPETLGEVRERELREACAILGIDPPIFLGYRDSGMEGTEPNHDPRAFINGDRSEMLQRLVREVRRLRPDLIITFEPFGIYGHPDHRLVSQLATDAFAEAGTPELFPEEGDPWQPAKLYYATFVREWFQRWIESRRRDGEDAPPSRRALGTPEAEITTFVDISDVLEIKRRALQAHRTQLRPDGAWNREWSEEQKRLFGIEAFIRAAPPLAPGERDEIFAPVSSAA